jgi:hypothetical protein
MSLDSTIISASNPFLDAPTEREINYEIEGDKIKMITPEGTLILTKLQDGSIQAPFGKLIKKNKR